MYPQSAEIRLVVKVPDGIGSSNVNEFSNGDAGNINGSRPRCPSNSWKGECGLGVGLLSRENPVSHLECAGRDGIEPPRPAFSGLDSRVAATVHSPLGTWFVSSLLTNFDLELAEIATLQALRDYFRVARISVAIGDDRGSQEKLEPIDAAATGLDLA